METTTLDTSYPHNSHQILVEKDSENYKAVVSAEENHFTEEIKGVLSIRKKTEEGWKAMLSLPEEVEKAAIQHRMEAEKQ